MHPLVKEFNGLVEKEYPMGKPKHTPGPWVAGQFNVATPKASYLVKGMGASAGELRANAALIAAAPEMLAALEVLVTHAPNTESEQRFKALIAKAKGEL